MTGSQIIGLLGLVILTAAFITLRIWWRRHRAHETARQKLIEDRQIEKEGQVW